MQADKKIFYVNANCEYDTAVNVSHERFFFVCVCKTQVLSLNAKAAKLILMILLHSFSPLLIQTFLLLILLSMMNCAVHQVLKILLKITLVISLCVIFVTVATIQIRSIHLDIFNHERYACYACHITFLNANNIFTAFRLRNIYIF